MTRNPIRLTNTSYAVLGLLQVFGPSTPYELKRALEKSVENFWPVPHTTFYAEPSRLAKAGYLTEEQEPGGRRRKVYSLTDRGRAALEEWRDQPESSPPQHRDEGVLKVFVGADPVPILRRRAEWHRAKLAELEGYLAEVEGGSGSELSLRAGITYHRQLLKGVEDFLEG